MQKFSDTQIFPSSSAFRRSADPLLVAVDANGGSLAIEVNMGDGTWIAIPDSPWSADTAFTLDVANGQFRFTPSGGATYSLSY